MENGIRAFHSSVDNNNYVLNKSSEGLQLSRVEADGSFTPVKCKAYDTCGGKRYIVRADDSLKNMRQAEELLNAPKWTAMNYSTIAPDSFDFSGKQMAASGTLSHGKIDKLQSLHINLKEGESLAPSAARILKKIAEFMARIR